MIQIKRFYYYLKDRTIRLLLCAELVACGWYVLNPREYYTVMRALKQEHEHIISACNTIQMRIRTLNAEIEEWRTYSAFFTEKAAREKLKMARPSEQVYKYASILSRHSSATVEKANS